jgi:hypothetical protein
MLLTDNGRYLFLRTSQGIAVARTEDMAWTRDVPAGEGVTQLALVTGKKQVYRLLTIDRQGNFRDLSLWFRGFHQDSLARDHSAGIFAQIPDLHFYQLEAIPNSSEGGLPRAVFLGAAKAGSSWVLGEGIAFTRSPGPFIGVLDPNIGHRLALQMTGPPDGNLYPVTLGVSIRRRLIFVGTGRGGIVIVLSLPPWGERLQIVEQSRWGYSADRTGWVPFAPSGIKVDDANGLVWIGSYNVLVSFTFDGRQQNVIEVTGEDDVIGDFSLSRDGRIIWATCRESHRVARISLRKGKPSIQYVQRVTRPALVRATKRWAYVLDESGRQLSIIRYQRSAK